METLATSYGKSPYSIKPGDRLRSSNLGQVQRAKVISVGPPNEYGVIIISTEDAGKPLDHAFHPGQVVAFPRRANGQNKVHWELDPPLPEVKVGDIIPPKGGWPDRRPDLESGLLVTDILPSQRYGGFIISYRPVNGGRGGKMFSDMTPTVYGGSFTEFPEELPNKPRFKPEPKTASGVYVHLETGEEVRFRIAGKRGRSPENTTDAPGSTLGAWEPWALVSGKAHPSDPRK